MRGDLLPQFGRRINGLGRFDELLVWSLSTQNAWLFKPCVKPPLIKPMFIHISNAAWRTDIQYNNNSYPTSCIHFSYWVKIFENFSYMIWMIWNIYSMLIAQDRAHWRSLLIVWFLFWERLGDRDVFYAEWCTMHMVYDT